MSNLLVLNGQYYSGVNTEANTLTFAEKRAEATKIKTESELQSILEIVLGWVAYDGFKVRRIEVLDVKEDASDGKNSNP